MNIYIISQEANNNYDAFDSAIVCAEDSVEARNMNPSNGMKMEKTDWKSNYSPWCSNVDQVKAKLIGVADEAIKKGVILSSFNAG
jgi:hypothetical protein